MNERKSFFIIYFLINSAFCDDFKLNCPPKVVAIAGSDLTINCTGSGAHGNFLYACWARKGVVVAEYPRKSRNPVIILDESRIKEDDFSLPFHLVKVSDSGNYTCTVTFGEIFREKNVTVIVAVPHEEIKQEHSKPTAFNNVTVSTGYRQDTKVQFIVLGVLFASFILVCTLLFWRHKKLGSPEPFI
ncbi:uncharacterized protein LOC114655306 isoform X2 [Erpetoichthys calabaricus]|uniref:uncharacterized protein LOC114655306 isoform X2 n=1 Tax=Erpetoichthys calabaricus TaxID=27687 RepID=UPI0022344284|nr:uncharacterized protein LOC114655306 isoform X2 [Erpetoichthys calabaricus]